MELCVEINLKPVLNNLIVEAMYILGFPCHCSLMASTNMN